MPRGPGTALAQPSPRTGPKSPSASALLRAKGLMEGKMMRAKESSRTCGQRRDQVLGLGSQRGGWGQNKNGVPPSLRVHGPLPAHLPPSLPSSIHPSSHASIPSSIHPCMPPSLPPSILSSIHPSLPSSIHPFLPPSIHPSLHASIPSSIHPSIQPRSVYPSALAHVHPSVRPREHISVALSVPPSLEGGRRGGSGGSTHRDAGSRLRCLVA